DVPVRVSSPPFRLSERMSTPGADRKTSGAPKFEKSGDDPSWAVAATPIAPGHAAGYEGASVPTFCPVFGSCIPFPAAATTTTPFETALATASQRAVGADWLYPPRLRLITRAPWLTANVIPAATSASVPLPE